ncbi:MAG: copper resistance protein CopB [Rhodobiaceae bacterium]|nr:copper resistance protein CopB [Rhodobiaceae bacterium]
MRHVKLELSLLTTFSLLLSLSLTIAADDAHAESLIWGIQAEQAEYRYTSGERLAAWDFDALIGNDELKFVWRSEAEFNTRHDNFETLENQFRIQVPVSDFFDAVAGVRLDTPDGPDRIHGVLGLHGLAEQWFEVDADIFFSEDPSARFEIEYEALVTNRLILTPSFEVNVPFTDDDKSEVGAWAPSIELGARLSYDLIDRAVSPYVGVHYERSFGETARIAERNGSRQDELYIVIGTKFMY